jgi:predicted transcriptional regulator
MAKGDVAATFTLPKEVDDLITTMAQRRKTTRRAVIVQAVRAMAASKSEKALWTPTP